MNEFIVCLNISSIKGLLTSNLAFLFSPLDTVCCHCQYFVHILLHKFLHF